MRHLVSKLMTASMVAGAALFVSACGGGETPAADNATTTDLNATDPMMSGEANDTMTDGDAMMNTEEANAMDGNAM